jgi:hypothetical protein
MVIGGSSFLGEFFFFRIPYSAGKIHASGKKTGEERPSPTNDAFVN